MTRLIERCAAAAGAVLALAILGGPTASAQDAAPANPQSITAPSPLLNVADMLEAAYARPVTYEESLLVWQGDLVVDPYSHNAKPIMAPKSRSFVLPFRLGGAGAPALDAALLGRIVDAYHAQSDGPRFRVASTNYALHILPASASDASGRLAPVVSLLDTAVTVPFAMRSPMGHLAALSEAVSAASGTVMKDFDTSMGFDALFAPGGAQCPFHGPSMKPGDVTPSECLFNWGADSGPARQALIGLLSQSATTMTWRLQCHPKDQVMGGYCLLSVGPMIVNAPGPDGRPRTNLLLFDRCTACPVPGRHLAPVNVPDR